MITQNIRSQSTTSLIRRARPLHESLLPFVRRCQHRTSSSSRQKIVSCSTRQFTSFPFLDYDEQQKNKSRQQQQARHHQVCFDAMPLVSLPPSSLTRCISTTTSQHHGMMRTDDSPFMQSRDSSSDTRMTQKFRDRAEDMRTNMHNRASTFRDSAQESYRHARENPRESAISGAKTFGTMLKQYGPVFIGTYLGVYFTTLGILFAGVESGVLDPVQLFGFIGHASEQAAESKSTVDFVVEFMRDHRMTRPYAPWIEKNPEVANLAVAWVAVKFTEPIRLAVSLAITPRIARSFGFTPRPVVDNDEVEATTEGQDKNDWDDVANNTKPKENAK